MSALALTRTSVSHHLRRLEEVNAVSSVRQGRRLALFPKEVQHRAERSALGLLRHATTRLILEELCREPTRSWRELARRLDMTAHTVRWHVTRLHKEGVIHVLGRDGVFRGHVVHIHPVVRASLARETGLGGLPFSPTGPSVPLPNPPVPDGLGLVNPLR